MKSSCTMHHISYWEFFKRNYTPQLQNIDIMLKTLESPLSATEAAAALAISPQEVEKIMSIKKMNIIDTSGFLQIMMNGSSPLCRLMQRECECGSPTAYSPKHIAYIYQLMEEHVTEVFHKQGYTKISAQDVPNLLDKIFIFVIS